ncbi:hypothetical protein [Moorena sp. SIO3E8]|uniref:hypothetical protein n=1 Tax=Moorena sp. SIO3E8 TaxID=2607830 RepID=UPI0025D57488|nr:hypothetical protein [Moorena sp. SIO3E8]
MTKQAEIHLYTASTMNGWKPLIFLHEAEVDYEMTYSSRQGRRGHDKSLKPK